jgi:hypothetical protein
MKKQGGHFVGNKLQKVQKLTKSAFRLLLAMNLGRPMSGHLNRGECADRSSSP